MKRIISFLPFVFAFLIVNGIFAFACNASVATGFHQAKDASVTVRKDAKQKANDSDLQKKVTQHEEQNTAQNVEKGDAQLEEKNAAPSPVRNSVMITAVGDCTIGWDDRFTWGNRFDAYLERNDGDYGYYFAKVRDVFREGDFTIANLEGTFTSHTEKEPKTFNFSAPEDYKNVLMWGCVDAVSLGNNHTYDFGEIGYQDTMRALDSISIPYFGHDQYLVKEVRGIKIGMFSLLDYGCQYYQEIDKALAYLKSRNCDLIIASMHWGIEHTYAQTYAQVRMAHYLVDHGVDLVLGSHPHVLQGIEKYNGRYILYSLANFCFGGNTDPDDKDTMIFRQTFTFVDGKLQLDDNIKIIPASVSGVSWCNNYQPVVLEGAEKQRVMNKIMRYSSGFVYRE